MRFVTSIADISRYFAIFVWVQAFLFHLLLLFLLFSIFFYVFLNLLLLFCSNTCLLQKVILDIFSVVLGLLGIGSDYQLFVLTCLLFFVSDSFRLLCFIYNSCEHLWRFNHVKNDNIQIWPNGDINSYIHNICITSEFFISFSS